jgi:putative ABC transport system permease protein
MNSTELEVVGVFSTYSKEYDARAIRVLLDAAHAVLDTEAAHSLVLALDDTDATDTVRASVAELTRGGGYEVMTWRELDDFYRKAVALYQRQFSIFQAIILLMVLLSVANSVNMSAYERVGEFGTLRALGQRSQDVFRLVLAENGLMGLVGAVLGGVLGVLLAAAISHVGIPMPPPPNASKPFTAAIRPDALIVFSGVAIGFAATVASALLAARRASQVPIAEALRQNV